MSKKILPVSISIMNLDKKRLQPLRPVSVLDIYVNNTESFHPDGLFSVDIFGRIGSDERDNRFSYIDLKVEIFHPLYFKELIKLKRLYGEIISGTTYAVFEKGDFVRASEIDGQTGYGFFVEHFKDLKFAKTNSALRKARIDFLNKYRDTALTQYILVIPAGLRDLEIGSDGRTQEGEVNAFYRKLIGVSNSVVTKGIKPNDPTLNAARTSAQAAFISIYNFYNQIISGKNGFIMQKWASRTVDYSTRSVISGMSTSNAILGDPNNIGPNQTIIGLYQLMKAVEPTVINRLRTGYLSQVFTESSNLAYLVDTKTYTRQNVTLDSSSVDKWYSSKGLEKQIEYFGDKSLRNKAIKLKDHYLGLVYTDDKYFKVFGSIDELPEHFDKDKVHPLTYVELFYLCNFENWNKIPGFVTRYPVSGTGSIYPSYAYMLPTTKYYKREELGADWKPTGRIAHFYPELKDPEYIVQSSGANTTVLQV